MPTHIFWLPSRNFGQRLAHRYRSVGLFVGPGILRTTRSSSSSSCPGYPTSASAWVAVRTSNRESHIKCRSATKPLHKWYSLSLHVMVGSCMHDVYSCGAPAGLAGRIENHIKTSMWNKSKSGVYSGGESQKSYQNVEVQQSPLNVYSSAWVVSKLVLNRRCAAKPRDMYWWAFSTYHNIDKTSMCSKRLWCGVIPGTLWVT